MKRELIEFSKQFIGCGTLVCVNAYASSKGKAVTPIMGKAFWKLVDKGIITLKQGPLCHIITGVEA
jgi:hypothetical protein